VGGGGGGGGRLFHHGLQVEHGGCGPDRELRPPRHKKKFEPASRKLLSEVLLERG